MRKQAPYVEDACDLMGMTLEERAHLVLLTPGMASAGIHNAFRKLEKQYHPDADGGDTRRFQVINEAHELLAKGRIPKRPLLADDELVAAMIGEQVAATIDWQEEREKYEQWSKEQFYGVGVL